MAVRKLSQITAASSPPAPTDQIVGVGGGTTDQLYSVSQISLAVAKRQKLTANLTLYYRSDGSDTNNGLTDSPSGAFLTVQAAYNHAVSFYDFSGFTITIQAGNEAGTVSFGGVDLTTSWTGGGALVFSGNGSSANTIWGDNGTTNSDAFLVNTSLPSSVTLQELTLTSGNGNAINHQGFGIVNVGTDVNFGAVNQSHIQIFSSGATVNLLSNYTISGGGNFHWNIGPGSLGSEVPITVTLTGSPSFNVFARCDEGGEVFAPQITFSGSVGGGNSFQLIAGGTIIAGQIASYFPGTYSSAIQFSGFYRDTTTPLDYVFSYVADLGAGSVVVSEQVGDIVCWNGARIGWASANFVDPTTATLETGLTRDGPYQIGQRIGGNPQKFSVYGTQSSGSNYERMSLDAGQTTAGVMRLMSEAAGPGTLRLLAFDAFSKAGAPAASDLPAETAAVIDDITNNQTWLVFNKAGTLRKVQLT